MKVAYVLGTFPSVSETFILREMLALRRAGIGLTVFALRRPAGAPDAGDAAGLMPAPCYRPSLFSAESAAAIVRLLGRPGRLLRVLRWILAAAGDGAVETLKRLRNLPAAACFARRAERDGVGHVHGHFAFMPADVARMTADLLGTGFSFSAHASDLYLQAPATLRRKVAAARFVAVCTRHGFDELARKIGSGSMANVHRVYHGLNSDRIAAAPPAPPEGVPLILAVGRLHPKKGFVTLVEAGRRLRERGVAFRCTIVGEGPARRAIEDAAARHGVRDAFELPGERPQRDIEALLSRARVFVLPCEVLPDGDRDGLPNAILEAMAAGVPVVATPVAGIPEAIEEGRTGLLAPEGDAGALADRIEELLKNADLCRRMTGAGLSVVRERFDLDRNVVPLIALFERVCRNS